MQSVFWTAFCLLSWFLFMGLAADICGAIRERRESEVWTKTLKLWCTTLGGVVATGGAASDNQAVRAIRTLTNTGLQVKPSLSNTTALPVEGGHIPKGVPANGTASMAV